MDASTKGAVLLFVASEVEYRSRALGAVEFLSGIAGCMVGDAAQAYATVGFCTCMKTAETTRLKQGATGLKPPGALVSFLTMLQTDELRGINKGVNAVAIRQVTNWGSRFGFSRLVEDTIRSVTEKGREEKLGVAEKMLASGVGSALASWNQPIEVIRVEMQSLKADPNRPAKLSIGSTFQYIYSQSGIRGLYRGVTSRSGLGIWQTVCMVALGDL
jgi:hypothetical protein